MRRGVSGYVCSLAPIDIRCPHRVRELLLEGIFQYAPRFVSAGIEISPIAMPVTEAPYTFPGLPREAFKGLPGLLADALPDRYGNALIDIWLAETGRTIEEFNPVDRLCYVGRRGVGRSSSNRSCVGATDGIELKSRDWPILRTGHSVSANVWWEGGR